MKYENTEVDVKGSLSNIAFDFDVSASHGGTKSYIGLLSDSHMIERFSRNYEEYPRF